MPGPAALRFPRGKLCCALSPALLGSAGPWLPAAPNSAAFYMERGAASKIHHVQGWKRGFKRGAERVLTPWKDGAGRVLSCQAPMCQQSWKINDTSGARDQ